jgi:succinate dehydrogenase/fumarate reductase cytochrome b subunit
MDKWIGIIGGFLGILVVVVGFILAMYKIMRRFENIEESSKYRKEENIVLIKATLAICDGLIQLKCNGPVTECKKELQQYLIKRGE